VGTAPDTDEESHIACSADEFIGVLKQVIRLSTEGSLNVNDDLMARVNLTQQSIDKYWQVKYDNPLTKNAKLVLDNESLQVMLSDMDEEDCPITLSAIKMTKEQFDALEPLIKE